MSIYADFPSNYSVGDVCEDMFAGVVRNKCPKCGVITVIPVETPGYTCICNLPLLIASDNPDKTTAE